MTAANRAALATVRERARSLVDGRSEPVRAPVTLNFHPDRRVANGRTVAEGLLDDGAYRNQFETGYSNGALGGERLRWESALFAGAYDASGVTAAERPKYGGLNLRHDPAGACPAFGSCHLRLRPHVLERTTLLFGDSAQHGTTVGTADAAAAVLAAAEVEEPSRFVYVEAHVHGPVDLAADAEALVLDPCYAGARIEAVTERYGLALEWHDGFRLPVADVPSDGPEGSPWRWERFLAGGAARRFAERIAGEDGVLDAAVVGRAAPTAPRDAVKDLWTIVVAFAP